eukprot:11218942-Lingulodinium_polyedra.AAC.1
MPGNPPGLALDAPAAGRSRGYAVRVLVDRHGPSHGCRCCSGDPGARAPYCLVRPPVFSEQVPRVAAVAGAG